MLGFRKHDMGGNNAGVPERTDVIQERNEWQLSMIYSATGKLGTFAFGQGYPWLSTLTNDKNVCDTTKHR